MKKILILLSIVLIIILICCNNVHHDAYNPEYSGHWEVDTSQTDADGCYAHHFVYDSITYYPSEVVAVDDNTIVVNYDGELLSFYGDGYSKGDTCYIAYIEGKIVDAK